MAWGVTAAVAGSALLGYISSSNAANSAADAQTNAANAANATTWNMYQQQRQDQQPWMQAGQNALGQLQQQMPDLNRDFTMADFQQSDPGFAFRMQEGQKAIERSAAAKGGLNSGATMKALARYSQDYASNEYQNAYSRFTNDRTNRYNRLAGLAGVGQQSVNQVGSYGSNAANNVSQNQMGMGNAQAANYIAQGNAVSNAGNGMANSWMNYQLMNRLYPQQEKSPLPNTSPA